MADIGGATCTPPRRQRIARDWAAQQIQPRICISCGEQLSPHRWPQCWRCELLARMTTAHTPQQRQRLRQRLDTLDEHRRQHRQRRRHDKSFTD